MGFEWCGKERMLGRKKIGWFQTWQPIFAV
jgi:hypothetical protein